MNFLIKNLALLGIRIAGAFTDLIKYCILLISYQKTRFLYIDMKKCSKEIKKKIKNKTLSNLRTLLSPLQL